MTLSEEELTTLCFMAKRKIPSLSREKGWGHLEDVAEHTLICFICGEIIKIGYDSSLIVAHGKFHLQNIQAFI